MKIRFSQSGGIVGLPQSCEIDTQALPVPEAAEIENLVKISGVLKTKFALSRIVACDIFGYSISVESSEITYNVKFTDLTIPEDGRGFAKLSQETCTARTFIVFPYSVVYAFLAIDMCSFVNFLSRATEGMIIPSFK